METIETTKTKSRFYIVSYELDDTINQAVHFPTDLIVASNENELSLAIWKHRTAYDNTNLIETGIEPDPETEPHFFELPDTIEQLLATDFTTSTIFSLTESDLRSVQFVERESETARLWTELTYRSMVRKYVDTTSIPDGTGIAGLFFGKYVDSDKPVESPFATVLKSILG